MKGMKKTNDGFRRAENAYRGASKDYLVKDGFRISTPCTTTKPDIKNPMGFDKPSIDVRRIIATLMLLVGLLGMIFCLVEAVFMTYPEKFSDYIVFEYFDTLGFTAAICYALCMTGFMIGEESS